MANDICVFEIMIIEAELEINSNLFYCVYILFIVCHKFIIIIYYNFMSMLKNYFI
jgi:hypothetical protein